MAGLERECRAEGGDRFFLALTGRERQPQIVMELGLVGNRLDRAPQQRERCRPVPALLHDSAPEMLRKWMAGLNGKRFPVDPLGGPGITLLVQRNRLLDGEIERRSRQRG